MKRLQSVQFPLESHRYSADAFFFIACQSCPISSSVCDALLESIDALEGFHAPFCIFITEFLSASLM